MTGWKERANARTVVNLGAALVSFLVQSVLTFCLSPYVVSRLGESAYGFLNLASNFTSYATLLTVAVNSVACRTISYAWNRGKEKEAESIFSSVYMLNGGMAVFIFVLALVLIWNLQRVVHVEAGLVNEVRLTFVLSFVSLGISLVGTVYEAGAYVSGRMAWSSLVQVVSKVVNGLLILVLYVFLPAKISYYAFAGVVSGLVLYFGNRLLTRKFLPGLRVKVKTFSFGRIVMLAKSGVWMLLSKASNLMLSGMDLLVCNWMLGSVLMGRLSLAKQLPISFGNALWSLSAVFSSALTRAYASGDESRLAWEAKNQLRLLSVVFTVPLAGIVAYGREFLGLWLGSVSYTSSQLDEIYILMLLIFFEYMVSVYMYSLHSVFLAMDKLKVYGLLLFGASVISLGLSVFLAGWSSLGVYALAGTSSVILSVVHGIVVPVYGARILGKSWSYFLKSEAKSWFCLLALSGLFVLIRPFLNLSCWAGFLSGCFMAGLAGYGFVSLCWFKLFKD